MLPQSLKPCDRRIPYLVLSNASITAIDQYVDSHLSRDRDRSFNVIAEVLSLCHVGASGEAW